MRTYCTQKNSDMTKQNITALRIVDNSGKEVQITADLSTGWIDFDTVPAGNDFIEITTGSAFRIVKAIVID